MTNSQIVVYDNGEIELNISFKNETIWLTQKQLCELFGVEVHTINYHIKNIFKQKELDKNTTIRKIRIVQKEGKREVSRDVEHYNLDMIICVGYRVNSLTATKFRQWATSVLKNYIQNGYAINSEKLTQQRLLSLENDVKDIKSHIQNNTLEIKQGIFYDGEIFDAYAFINNLLKSAKNEVTIIDNYTDDSVFTIFSKYPKIKFKIITKSISKQLKLDTKKYNAQYKNLTITTSNKYHDRFILIDKTTYHIGASLKDLGKKVFAFSKMDISGIDL
jgi:prophage antirepressor-like protein